MLVLGPMLFHVRVCAAATMFCVCSLPLAGAASMGAPAVVVRHDGFIKRDRCVLIVWVGRGGGGGLCWGGLRCRLRNRQHVLLTGGFCPACLSVQQQ